LMEVICCIIRWNFFQGVPYLNALDKSLSAQVLAS